eukprot:206458_1
MLGSVSHRFSRGLFRPNTFKWLKPQTVLQSRLFAAKSTSDDPEIASGRYFMHDGIEVYKDGVYDPDQKLHHNVLETGLRSISFTSSRISLADIAAKLQMGSVTDVVAKAIHDGVISTVIDKAGGFIFPKFDTLKTKSTSVKSLAPHKTYAPLWRLSVRDMRQTVAVGIINSIVKATDTKSLKSR